MKASNNAVTANTHFITVSKIRNPMLLGLFIFLIGLGVLLDSLSLIFIFTPLFVLINVVYLKAVEEKEMEKKFGGQYLEYEV